MNFHDFFRGAFGFPRQYSGNNFDEYRDGSNNSDPDPFLNDRDYFNESYRRSDGPFDFQGFNIFGGDVFDMHRYFEQQVDEMMRSFGSMGAFNFDFGSMDSPVIGDRSVPRSAIEESSGHLRDRYVKPHYDNRPVIKADDDIDAKFEKDGIDSVLPGGTSQMTPVPVPPLRSSSLFSRSYSTKVIMGSNGRMEKQETRKGSDGAEVTTVTRKVGDQEHTVKKIRDRDGRIETHEEFINLDENQLNEFDKNWSNGRRPQGILPGSNPSEGSDHGFIKLFDPIMKFIK